MQNFRQNIFNWRWFRWHMSLRWSEFIEAWKHSSYSIFDSKFLIGNAFICWQTVCIHRNYETRCQLQVLNLKGILRTRSYQFSFPLIFVILNWKFTSIKYQKHCHRKSKVWNKLLINSTQWNKYWVSFHDTKF
jgi:hypothetical protein